MPDTYLQISGLTRLYGRKAAVDGMSLDLSRGELFVLLGPSGCGKTTTLRLLAGLETPSRGEIVLDGKNLNRVPPRDRNVAMVFQEHTLYPHMRIGENLGFSLKMQGLGGREIRERVLETARVLGLEDRLGHWPHQLSGGEAQRVALGKALVRRPDLLLLDEPLSNLDPPLRRKLREEILALQRRYSITTIHVTHDQEDAMALGGRIGIMHEGRLLQTGSPKAIYESPNCVFGARFLGSPPINLIPAELVPGQNLVRWSLGGERVSFRCARLPNPAAAPGEAWLGVRPEHILVSARSKSPPEIKGRVELLQDMGFEHHLLVDCLDEKIRIRCSRLSEGVVEGAEVYLKVSVENPLLFRADTGERIVLEEPESAEARQQVRVR